MKDFKYICVQPDDTYYTWQVHLWLESLRKRGESHKAIVLVFTPNFRELNTKWEQIVNLYPEAEFKFYKDEHDASQMLGIYIPVLRPYTLWRYWKDNPNMANETVLYCDSDVIFTEKFNIDNLLEDEISYVSDTNSYINATYFDSKVRDVLPEKLEEYKTRDVLAEVSSLIGVNREIAEEHNLHSGGAQYLLKNVDASFWSKVMNDCIIIRVYLQKINKEFFESENKGFQSWCADMWAVLWNLWLREKEVKIADEMGFSWAPDPIEKLETHPILHNAGIVSTEMDGYKCFYKGKYHTGSDPSKDVFLEEILKDEKSMKRCTGYYTQRLKELFDKYNINY